MEVCAKTNEQKVTSTFLKLDELRLWKTNMLHYKTKRLQYQKYPFSFSGKNGDTLASLRYAKFMESVATCAVLEPETLPPRERPMYFHSLRVHLQVCQWKYLNLHCLKPEEWEWTFVVKVLKPIKTDMQPTPKSILKFVSCKRKWTSKNVYRRNLCSCRKYGLKCMVACGECRTESCGNSVDIVEEDYDEDMFERNLFDLFD